MAEKVTINVDAKTSKAQKALKDLNSSLEQIAETGDRNREGFELLDQATGGYAGKVKELAGSITSAIKGAKGFATSLKGVRGALLATGVGAIVVALASIVAYWDDIKGLVNGVNGEQEESLELQKEAVALAEQQSNVIGEMENTLKLQGKSEKEIRDLKRQQLNETISALEVQLEQEKQIKANQVAASERNKKIMMGFITIISAPLVAALSLIDAVSQGLAKLGVIEKATNLAQGFVEGTAELLFDPEEVAEEGDKTIEATEKKLRQLKNKRDGFILQDKKEQEQKQKEADDKEIEDAKKKADALEKIRQGEIDTEAEKRAEERKKIQDHYKELIRLAELYGEDTTALKEAQKTKEDELQAKFDQQDKDKLLKEQQEKIEQLEIDKINEELSFEEQRAIVNARQQLLLDDELLNDKQKLELKKQFSEATKKIDEAEGDFKKKQLEETMELMGNVQALVGKQTAAGKALGIATATVNTFVGVSEALKQESTLPSPFDVVAKVANVATVLASGLGAVKSITAVNIPGGYGGGGGGGAVPTAPQPQAPSFNIVGATETSQLAESIGQQTQEPIQAYVVANDVTTAQSLNNNIVEGATL
jgi:hypothetical protein